MKLALATLMTLALTLAVGCTSVSPKNDQQAVYAAGGPVGVAFMAANTYQALNSCSAPAHTLPCSDDVTSAKVQAAKEKVLAAYKQADAVANSAGYQSGDWAKAQAILQGALDFLVAITPPAN
jgi:hypothetical protein